MKKGATHLAIAVGEFHGEVRDKERRERSAENLGLCSCNSPGDTLMGFA